MFDMQRKIVSGIDIGASGIRLVQTVKSGGGYNAINAVNRDYKNSGAAEITEILKELTARYSLHKTFVVASIPRHHAIVKYLTLPSVEKNEIRNMMEYEIPRQITLPIEKLCVDYEVITRSGYGSPEGRNVSEIMLAAAKTEAIEKQIGIFKAAGLAPEIISINSSATFCGFIQNYPGFNESAVIMNVSSGEADILFVNEERLLLKYSKSVSVSGADTKTEKVLSELKQAIDIFNSHTRFASFPVKKIFICGRNAAGADYLGYAGSNLKIEVEAYNPFKEIKTADNAVVNGKNNSYFAVALGLSLIGFQGGNAINLMPRKMIEQNLAARRKKKIIVSAAAAVLAALIGTTVFMKTARRDALELRKVNSEIEKIRSQTVEIEAIYDKIEMLIGYSGGNYSPLEALKYLAGNLKGRLSFTNFVFEKGKSVTVKGSAGSYTEVMEFLASLEKSGYFSQVTDKGSKQETVEDMGEKRNFVEFNIECLFASAAND